MLDTIINKNIVFLKDHGIKINSEEEKAVYKYGLQILYYYLIDLSVIFSFAFIFGKVYETAIMTFIFGLFQCFGGGYHAKNPLRCLVTMLTGAVAGNILVILISENPVFNITAMVIFCGIVLILTPVINKRHPVNKKIRKQSKTVIRVSTGLILGLVFLLSYFNKNIEVKTVEVALGLYTVSLITAKIKVFRVKYKIKLKS